MKTTVHLNTYILPTRRKDDIVKKEEKVDLFVDIDRTSYYNNTSYIQVKSDDSATVVLLGQQIVRAVKNAMNSVKGTMKVLNVLDTFDKVPKSHDDHKSLTLRVGEQVIVSSTDFAGYIEIVLPAIKSPGITVFTLKGEEVLAGVENITRS